MSTKPNKKTQKRKTSRRRGKKKSTLVSAPTSIASIAKIAKPQMAPLANGVRIRHRELVGSVAGDTAFATVKYVCNPGFAVTFPWLSTQATSWEQYTFHKLKFIYVTRTGTTTVGSVMMAPDYDVTDAVPTTEAQIMSFADSIEFSCWNLAECELDPKAMFPLGPRKYVRDVAVSEDRKTYDAANFYVATVELAGAASIGKLYVDYDISFYVPQKDTASPTLGTSFNAHFLVDVVMVTTVTKHDWDWLTLSDGLSIGADAAGLYTLPKGKYYAEADLCYFSDADITQVDLAVYKDGGVLADSYSHTTNLALRNWSAHCSSFIESDGTTTISIGSAVTSAGTISATSGRLRIVVA